MTNRRAGGGRVGRLAAALVLAGFSALGVDASTPLQGTTTAMEALAASMAPGTWAQLTTTNIVPTLSASGASGAIFGYNEDAAWDPAGQRLLYIGGDHNDVARYVAYSADTNAWQILSKPSWIPASTMHGYNHHAINTAKGELYHRPFGNRTIYKQSLATGAWTALPSFGSSFYNNGAMGLEYFPELGGLVFAGTTEGNAVDTVLLFSDATGQWSVLSRTAPMGGLHNFACYNPVHKVVIFGGGNDPGSRKVHKVDASGRVTALRDAPIGLGVQQSIVTVDPVSGDYLVFGGDGSFYVYDVASDAWTRQPGSPPFSTPNRFNAVWHVTATPVSTYGVTMFVKFYAASPSQAWVYLYKHAASAAPPTGDADGDGLPDAWEVQHFGDLNQTGSGDPDGDGATNAEEYSAGTDPMALPTGGTSPAGGGHEGDEGCGATGLEGFLFFLLIATRRRS